MIRSLCILWICCCQHWMGPSFGAAFVLPANNGAATTRGSIFVSHAAWRRVVEPPRPPSTSEVLQTQINQMAKNSALIGNLKMITSKLSLQKSKMILMHIAHAIHWEEIFFFFFMGWIWAPLVEIPQNFFRERFFKHKFRPFDKSYTKILVDNIALLSRIGFGVYMVDILEIFLRTGGFTAPQLQYMSEFTGASLFTWWVASRLSALKRHFIKLQTTNVAEGELSGTAELVDRLIDALLYGLGAFLLLDSVRADFGAATKGIAALGGVSTLVISLASQGLVSQVFYGLFLATSKKIRRGDVVSFGEGKIKGLIASMGWTDTLIRGGDGVLMSVPNKELADKSISNLSRIQISNVKQELRFRYKDAEKLPKLMEDIKDEIRAACPEVIDDGSRPFRCYWTNYGRAGLEVTVDCNFRIKLLGDAYHENRQNMLIAIRRAVKKNGMTFATLLDEEVIGDLYDAVSEEH